MSSLLDLASLVLAPTAVKDGKVYNAIPNDQDFTFSRGTEATRVNSAGLIEKARTNYLLQSNTFNTTWGQINSSVTINAITAPDGSLTASKIVEDTSNSQHRLDQATTSSSGVNTFSVYLKQGERTTAWLRIGLNGCYVDLTDGSISNVASNIIASSTELANDWYRVSITKTNASANETVRINIQTGDYTGDGTSGIYVWSSQYEQGLVATDVITTTTSSVTVGITDDLPRVDYSGGGCPSLLLEPSRTNVVTQSEYIDSFNNFTIGDGSISSTSNYAISPEGVKNATRIVASATGSNYAIKSFTPSSSTTGNYVCSMYIKSNTSLNQSISFYARGAGFNPITVTPEWQRFVVTGTGSTNFLNVGITQASGQENIDILVYGAQMEQDVSYVSSYIPSYGTSTSRSADSCSLTNASNLIGQTEGTLFAEFEINGDISVTRNIVNISNGTTTDFVAGYFFNDLFYARIRANNGSLIDVTKSGVSDGLHKVAIAYADNDLTLYLDGALVGQNTSASVAFSASLPNIAIGTSVNFTNELGDGINQAILFPTRLTNDQLQELTK